MGYHGSAVEKRLGRICQYALQLALMPAWVPVSLAGQWSGAINRLKATHGWFRDGLCEVCPSGQGQAALLDRVPARHRNWRVGLSARTHSVQALTQFRAGLSVSELEAVDGERKDRDR